MKTASFFIAVLFLILLLSASVLSAGPDLPTVGKVLDQELKSLENEFVPLADAMPAGKYGFAPTSGEFTGVRTFGQQVKHAGANIYAVSAAILGEPLTPAMGDGDNAPASLVSKDDILAYLKGAFTLAHRAMATLTAGNMAEEVTVSWGKASRLYMADVAIWHTYDHYGQLVVYLRMNGIIPPASRPRK